MVALRLSTRASVPTARGAKFTVCPMTRLTSGARNHIAAQAFAFPAQRKEPIENASHVRNAIARFKHVEGVSDTERDDAWKRILLAASRYGVAVHESSWRELD
jgi:hypothetical protein